jgi:hypothetical protein
VGTVLWRCNSTGINWLIDWDSARLKFSHIFSQRPGDNYLFFVPFTPSHFYFRSSFPIHSIFPSAIAHFIS